MSQKLRFFKIPPTYQSLLVLPDPQLGPSGPETASGIDPSLAGRELLERQSCRCEETSPRNSFLLQMLNTLKDWVIRSGFLNLSMQYVSSMQFLFQSDILYCVCVSNDQLQRGEILYQGLYFYCRLYYIIDSPIACQFSCFSMNNLYLKDGPTKIDFENLYGNILIFLYNC